MSFVYNISLNELIVTQKGIKPPLLRNKPFKKSVPYLDIDALENSIIHRYTLSELGTYVTEKDVLIVWDGSRSGLPLKGRKGVLGSTIMKLTPINLLPEYLYYFLKSKYELLNKNTVGGGIPHIDSKLFFELEIPFLSPDEQKKVITELNSRIKEGSLFLEKQRDVLYDTLNSENISLENEIEISISKIRDAVLQKEFSNTVLVNKKNTKTNKKEWSKNTLSSLSSLITSGSREWSKYYASKGSRFIRTQDIKDNYLDESDMLFVKLPQKIEGQRTLVKKGDLLFTIVGSNIGKSAVVNKNFKEKAYVSQNVALIRVTKNINVNYLHLYLQSPIGLAQLKNKITGDAQPTISLQDVRNLSISYPDLNEQKKIVKRINLILKLFGNIQNKYQIALEKVSNLEKSLLQEAFSKKDAESSVHNETRNDVLNLLRKEKEKIILNQKGQRKSSLKYRNEMKKELSTEKKLMDILSANSKMSIEELWKESKYYQGKDVEAFYEELTSLKKEGLIEAIFSDKSKTITDIILK